MNVRLGFALLLLPLGHAAAQPAPRAAAAAPAAVQLTYADIAALALEAPVAAHVRLRRALPLKSEEAPGVAAGFTRFYVEADALALIRGEPGMPTQLRYLADFPNGASGRPARPARKSEWLVFARPVAGRPGELQLTAPNTYLAFSPQVAERTRTILREALAPDAPPALTGIGRAFHVPGVLQGASETQIFLQTAGNRPVSINVVRQPQVPPRWFVSMSEFVDAGATQPKPDTLLWYRLACALPAQLPRAALAEAAEHEQAIAADYRLVREGLGSCMRTRS